MDATQQKKQEYQARQERLKRVARSIDRGIGGPFYGADFQLGFNYVFGEIIELQREFNKRFSMDMPSDPRFAEFYDRIIQIMESSHVVLTDSIDPNARKKYMAELAKENARLEASTAETKKKAQAPDKTSKKQGTKAAGRGANKNKPRTNPKS